MGECRLGTRPRVTAPTVQSRPQMMKCILRGVLGAGGWGMGGGGRQALAQYKDEHDPLKMCNSGSNDPFPHITFQSLI